MRSAILAVLTILTACSSHAPPPADPPTPVATADAGASTSAAPLSVGTSCTADKDCGGAKGSVCLKTSFGVPIPGGYCSARCAATTDCGTDPKIVCATPKGSSYPGASDVCLQRCDPKAGQPVCRDGLVCRPLTQNGAASSDFACWAPIPG